MIVEFDGTCMFNCLRNCQTALQNSRTILLSYQQCMRASVVSYPCPHLAFSVLNFSHSSGYVASHCDFKLISLMTNEAEKLFMCLFAICISSWLKYLFKSFAHLKNWVGTSLVAQWLRICLPMQGTWV